MKLFEIKNADNCSSSHARQHRNANGRLIVWLDCPRCKSILHCLKHLVRVEGELNAI